jgi:hypothetical protein
MAEDSVSAEYDRDRLTFPRQFLLWSVRIWVAAYHQQRSPMPALERAFVFLGSPAGASLLDRAMTALGEAGRRQIDVRPPCYRALSEDERRILDIATLAQRGDADAPRFLLLSLVAPDRRRTVEARLRDLARDLAAVGLDLASPAPPADRTDCRAAADASPAPRSPAVGLRGAGKSGAAADEA